MRIATWNMNYQGRTAESRRRAWEFLRDKVRADVVLVQEAVPDGVLALPSTEALTGKGWGATIAVLHRDLHVVALDQYSLPAGTGVVGKVVHSDGRQFLAICSLAPQAPLPASIPRAVIDGGAARCHLGSWESCGVGRMDLTA